MTSAFKTRREDLRSELEAARREFYDMVASISEPWWAKPSHNPGWTNGQLLFHVLLGFILVLPLAGILLFFGHLQVPSGDRSLVDRREPFDLHPGLQGVQTGPGTDRSPSGTVRREASSL
jgi:hypothetical protein